MVRTFPFQGSSGGFNSPWPDQPKKGNAMNTDAIKLIKFYQDASIAVLIKGHDSEKYFKILDAAPDLYEALELLVEQCERHPGLSVEVAKQALRKAGK